MTEVKMPTTIAVASRKGGVGKTMIASGLASLLAARGGKVLAMDLDPQSNLAFNLGGDVAAAGTAALLTGEDVTPQVITDSLHVLAGGPALNDGRILQFDPEELSFFVSELPYDYIVIDCPPTNERLERLGLVAADVAVVPMDAHPNAFTGVVQVVEVLKRRRLRGQRGPKRWIVVANRLDLRRRLDRNAVDFLADFEAHMTIPQDAAVASATAAGQLLATVSTPAVKQLSRLTEWCIEATNGR